MNLHKTAIFLRPDIIIYLIDMKVNLYEAVNVTRKKILFRYFWTLSPNWRNICPIVIVV